MGPQGTSGLEDKAGWQPERGGLRHRVEAGDRVVQECWEQPQCPGGDRGEGVLFLLRSAFIEKPSWTIIN